MSQQNILGDGDVRAQVDFLIDRANAELYRMLRRSNLDRGALQLNAALIRVFHAGQDLNQGGLSSPILAHQGVNFPLSQEEVNALKSNDTREGFPNAFHADNVLSVCHRFRLPLMELSPGFGMAWNVETTRCPAQVQCVLTTLEEKRSLYRLRLSGGAHHRLRFVAAGTDRDHTHF